MFETSVIFELFGYILIEKKATRPENYLGYLNFLVKKAQPINVFARSPVNICQAWSGRKPYALASLFNYFINEFQIIIN